MARKNHLCPIMKKTCVGCSVYRGRHIGLWTNEEPAEGTAHAGTVPSNGNSPGWVASLHSFFKDVSDMEGTVPGWD
jgi:hypothetical protein